MKKIKIFWPGITLMLSLAILAVPATIFYNIAIETQEIAGNPVFGERFNNDLNPKIQRNQINELQTTIAGLESVVDSEVNLRAATLRVNILTDISLTELQLNALITNVKEAIFAKLPQSDYFTATLTTKQYDLEIHVRNTKDRLDENYRYIIASKTSLMSSFNVQEVSKPKNPEYVAGINEPVTIPEENDDE